MAYQDQQLNHFFSKIENIGEGCWLWLGKNSGRYGTLYLGGKRIFGKRKEIGAHRFSYEYFVGDIPEGLQIDHLCRNRSCVNPGHLEAVTQQENLLRGETVNAKNKARTECVNGHPFDVNSPYYATRGWRRCSTCHNLAEARRRQNRVISA